MRDRANARNQQVHCLRTGEEEDDAEDVALLLSIAHDTCTAEQLDAMRQIFGAKDPWGVLGVSYWTSEKECLASYKALCALLHPDKCNHPKAEEAFKKLSDAYGCLRTMQ